MRIFIFAAYWLLLSVAATANNTTVTVRFKNLKDSTVNVRLPVNGIYCWFNEKTYRINRDSTVKISLQIDRIARIRVDGYSFIVEPGNIFITIDKSKRGVNAVLYKGKSAEGQLQYINRNNDFYQDAAISYYKKDSTALGLHALIKADKAKALHPYDSLLKVKKITQHFYDYIKNEIQIKFAAIAAHVPIELCLTDRRDSSKNHLTTDFRALWAKIYEEYPVNAKAALSASDYYYYASDYCDIYVNGYLLENAKTKKPKKKPTEGEYLIYYYDNLNALFSGNHKEYMLANFLAIEMLQERFQPELLTLYKRFAKAYPNSNYHVGLKPFVEKIVEYNAKVSTAFTKEHVFVEGFDKINSVDELLKKVDGKVIYVDIWATWCGPCKREFIHNKELKPQLKNQKIEMLYISMDDNDADQKWKDMIKYYDLAGNHIRVNDSLKQDLINRLWKGEGYAIPRYLIIKDGKIVVDDALRPSDKKKLYKQLATFAD